MRLVFFTPAAMSSAIARMAALVVSELTNQGHTIDVVRTERAQYLDTPIHQFGVNVTRWNDCNRVNVAISRADMVFHQIGNNFEYHIGSVEWLVKERGVVCLHDYFLGHLFWGWSAGRRDQAMNWLRRCYGEDVAQRYFTFTDPAAFISETHAIAPMTEWIAGMADAVVTHSAWAIHRVLQSCAGPVRVVPLPYDVRPLGEALRATGQAEGRKFTILTFGDINQNKRAESVVRAIGTSAILRGNVTYRLVGRIQPNMVDALASLAAQLSVDIEIMGSVDDASLYNAIEGADLVSCLRVPVLEAASASAIEAMLYGKPIIVSDAGFYSDIPDRCATRISLENEQRDLQQALETLYCNPDLRSKMGFEAAKWAARTYSTRKYARALLEIIPEVAMTAPVGDVMRGFVTLWNHWGDGTVAMLDSYTTGPLTLFGGQAGERKRVGINPKQVTKDIQNLTKPLIFVHIPKTAGTSFTAYLRHNISDPALVAEPFYGDLSKIKLERTSLRLFYGHFRFADISALKPDGLFVTFLRDPLARVISQYRSWHDPNNLTKAWVDAMPADELAAVRYTQTASLQEFILSDDPCIVNQMRNVQTNYLCDPGLAEDLDSAKANLAEKFCYFGVVERFDDSIALFRKQFDHSMPYALPREEENRSVSEQINLSGAALSRVRKLNEKDYDLYDFALRRLDDLVAQTE